MRNRQCLCGWTADNLGNTADGVEQISTGNILTASPRTRKARAGGAGRQQLDRVPRDKQSTHPNELTSQTPKEFSAHARGPLAAIVLI
jgi:hypothetical protein